MGVQPAGRQLLEMRERMIRADAGIPAPAAVWSNSGSLVGFRLLPVYERPAQELDG